MSTFLVWIPRVVVPLVAIATLVPLLRSGSWLVRICDFPRIQAAVILAIPVAFAVAELVAGTHRREASAWLAGAMFLAAWQLAHVAPFTPLARKQVPDASPGEPSVRVAIANIEFDNGLQSEVVDRLVTLEADVLLMIETDASWRDALARLDTSHPHRVEAIRSDGRGMILLSRLPIRNGRVRTLVSERRPSIHAVLVLEDGRHVRFVGVHPTPPGLDDDTAGGRRDSRVRDAELVLLAREIAKTDGESDQSDEPLAWIVAGDFNDVAWSSTTRLFRRLSGLADPRIGRGLYSTYHANHPMLRYPIDHVMVSSGFAIAGLDRERVPGSDHFAMVADLVLTHVRGIEPDADRPDRARAAELIDAGTSDARERADEGAEPTSP